MERLLVSTTNPGKLQQMQALSASSGVAILGLQDLGLRTDVTESGASFEENALLKMQAALEQVDDTALWVAGDDSGVMIDALGGEPGMHTGRWAGYDMTDQDIIDYTLRRLEGVPLNERTARGVSVVALGRAGIKSQLFEGAIEGVILEQPSPAAKPQAGFPFCQIFYLPERAQVIGEIEDGPPAFMNHWHRSFGKAVDYILQHS